ncbi:MAG: caspase family protein [Saprospiraceae bacterium]|nr:caspase family protein [Saprospiraceae bacterium]MCB0680015.1 caspase family protein [Saprospiraceae bacterium]
MKRLTLSIGIFLLAAATLLGQCISGDCRDGTGIYLFPSGAKYIGQFQNGKMEGIGSCYYTDGSKYQGEWVDSYPEGKGIKTLADGSQVKGKWKKGQPVAEPASPPARKEEAIAAAEPEVVEEEEAVEQQTGCISGNCRNGKGIYIYPSGAIYIGEFKDGEIHGIGACSYSDGSKYQGEWVYRYPEGRGTKTFADGKKWTGHWKKGQPVDDNGNIITSLFPDRDLASDQVDIQSGCVEGDCENGQGTFAYADGSKYEGTFHQGKPNGQGTFVHIDGEKYVGGFRNGFRHGKGQLIQPDGKKIAGAWQNGEYVGESQVAANQFGCVQGDCIHGRGTYIFREDGAKYVGSFRDQVPHGQGVIQYTNGERYSGEWAKGKFNGQGTLTLLDGTDVSGYWENGQYMGSSKPQAPPVSLDEVDLPELRKAQKIKVWAVVIGVSSYNHMPTLRYTDDDAYRMYAFLKSPEGGALSDEQVRILIDEDATKDGIVEVMKEVFYKAGPNDLVFLYYSGHGLKGAFLPIDFDGFNNKLEHEEINAILSESPAKYKLCIADACHSGSLLAMKSGEVKGILESYYNTLAQASPGTALIMSSKSEETSLESSGLRQGVFSHFLIRGLKGEADSNKDKIVTVQELYNFIFSNVRQYTGNRQSPVIRGDFDEKMTVSVIR